MTLRPSEIKTSENCRLPNSFGSAQTSSQDLRTFLGTFGSVLKIAEIFGRDWDVFGNPCIDKAKISRI